MRAVTHHFEGGAFTRFFTPRGNVIVIVRPDGEDAVLEVYEEKACLSANGKTDADFGSSEQVKAARNRFGTGLMLKILRHVSDANPWIKTWRGHRIPVGAK